MTAKVTIKFNKAALQQQVYAAAEKDLRVRANRVLSAARRRVPVDRGTLRASLAVSFNRKGTTVFARIGSNLPYAIFVHEGTGIYGPKGTPIRPRNRSVMVFTPRKFSPTGKRIKSGKVFTTKVAGMKGTPYLRDALPAAQG